MLGDRENNKAIIQVILLAAFLSGLAYYLQANIGLDMQDEGYLLYGAVQTAAGKVTKLDFRGYDPGRYYWMAAWTFLFGEGLVAMRFYLALFGGIGLCLGLLAARRVIRSFWGLIPLGVLLLVWIFPTYRPFEITFAMGTVFFVTRLIEAPTLKRYFWSGVFVGVAAFFGRNLGLYGLFAVTITALYIWLRLERGFLLKSYASFVGGIFLGYSPIFIMAIFIPGFFSAFIDSILFILRRGATNLPLPVPWPWHAIFAGKAGFVFLQDFFLGLLFLATPIVYLLCLVRLPFIKKVDIKRNALLTASLFTGIFYMHYAFSRADIYHLASSIHPFFLALAALVCLMKRGWIKKVLIVSTALFLALASIFTIIPAKPFIKKNITYRGSFVEYPIRGHKMWINGGPVMTVSTIERIVRQWVPADEGLFIAPYLPTMYYVLKRDSPTRDTYFLFKASPEEQAKIIASLEEHNVRWAIVGDPALDGRDDLRFSRTNEIVWAYLRRNYDLVDQLWSVPGYVFIHKRDQVRGK